MAGRALRGGHVRHPDLVSVALVDVEQEGEGHRPLPAGQRGAARDRGDRPVVADSAVGVLVRPDFVVHHSHVRIALFRHPEPSPVRGTRRDDVGAAEADTRIEVVRDVIDDVTLHEVCVALVIQPNLKKYGDG